MGAVLWRHRWAGAHKQKVRGGGRGHTYSHTQLLSHTHTDTRARTRTVNRTHRRPLVHVAGSRDQTDAGGKVIVT